LTTHPRVVIFFFFFSFKTRVYVCAQVLVRTEASGAVAVLHNDPTMMRVDKEPVFFFCFSFKTCVYVCAQVLVRTEASGAVAVLHNDPTMMRVDKEPVLDAPLTAALRCVIHYIT
jgi:hypothetical protein